MKRWSILMFLVPAVLAAGTAAAFADSDLDDADNPDLLAMLNPAPKSSPEEISVPRPQLKALISIDRRLNPYSLDAATSSPVSLRNLLTYAVDHNLEIGLSRVSKQLQKTELVGSLGKFLPDLLLGYNWQYLNGKLNIPLGQTAGPINLNTPFIISSAGIRYWGYRGGAVLFGALKSRDLDRAAAHAQKATVGSVLLETTRRYYDLVLAEAILQIRIQAVRVAQAQLKTARDLYDAGSGTKLDVYQSETLLSQCRQELIDQQIARRRASIEIAELLNVDQGLDLSPTPSTIKVIKLVSDQVPIATLMSLATACRPELKQFNDLRLAARRQIAISAAALQPTVALTGTEYGIGQTLGKSYTTVIAPVTLPGGTTVDAPRRVSRQISNLASLGFAVNWNLGSLGTTELASIRSAKLGARQALIKLNQEANQIVKQVRESYLSSLSARQKIQEAICQVRSAGEELRLSRQRFENGLGTNIEVLRAQKDFTQSFIDKARAIVNFNVSQAQLLHDIGAISIDSVSASRPVVEPSLD